MKLKEYVEQLTALLATHPEADVLHRNGDGDDMGLTSIEHEPHHWGDEVLPGIVVVSLL